MSLCRPDLNLTELIKKYLLYTYTYFSRYYGKVKTITSSLPAKRLQSHMELKYTNVINTRYGIYTYVYQLLPQVKHYVSH